MAEKPPDVSVEEATERVLKAARVLCDEISPFRLKGNPDLMETQTAWKELKDALAIRDEVLL